MLYYIVSSYMKYFFLTLTKWRLTAAMITFPNQFEAILGVFLISLFSELSTASRRRELR